MKEYATLIIAGALLAAVVYGGIYSGVSQAISDARAVIERAVPHE